MGLRLWNVLVFEQKPLMGLMLLLLLLLSSAIFSISVQFLSSESKI